MKLVNAPEEGATRLVTGGCLTVGWNSVTHWDPALPLSHFLDQIKNVYLHEPGYLRKYANILSLLK